jgi:hypothetical protein
MTAAGIAAAITAIVSAPWRARYPWPGFTWRMPRRTAADLACRYGLARPGAWAIRRVWRLRGRFPGRPAGHLGRPDHARGTGRVSNNPGLTRDTARQRGYGHHVPWLLEVMLIGGPLCGLRGRAAAGILPRWRDGLRVPAL